MTNDQLAAAMQLRGEYVIDDSQVEKLTLTQRGEALAVLCSSCHGAPGQYHPGLLAPNLDGMWNRPIASAENFEYSAALPALRKNGEEKWTPDLLDRFLANPREMVPGTKMEFQGLLNEEDRQALIQHLKRSR